MKPQFPALSSPQRLSVAAPTAATAKKIPLTPGHSLMDWIRLTKSGVDLRGTGSKLLQVSEEELAKHDKIDDTWMAIRGYVYNVTRYMNYHPGGPDELMRGAGKDATTLFNEIHRWVNFESMLKACLVGKYVGKDISINASKFSSTSSTSSGFLAPPPAPSVKSKLPPANDLKSNISTSAHFAVPPKVFTEWNQDENTITVMLRSSVDVNASNIVCDVLAGGYNLYATVFVGDNAALLNIKFSHPVQLPPSNVVSNKNQKALEIRLIKSSNDSDHRKLEYLENHCKVMDRKSIDLKYRLCTLVGKTDVTYDTSIYRFELPETCYMRVPIGCHVYLQAEIDGITISHPYTVAIPDITERLSLDTKDIYLMIKSYPFGALTPYISKLKVGDQMLLSTYEGTFSMDVLESRELLLLFCAGTGLTPMIRVIHNVLFESAKKVKLFFFNKQRRDILWNSELEQLVALFRDRFTVQHILSEPDEEWTGSTGRITSELIEKAFQSSPAKTFACLCGPPLFTRLTVNLLKQNGVASSSFHPFTD